MTKNTNMRYCCGYTTLRMLNDHARVTTAKRALQHNEQQIKPVLKEIYKRKCVYDISFLQQMTNSSPKRVHTKCGIAAFSKAADSINATKIVDTPF